MQLSRLLYFKKIFESQLQMNSLFTSVPQVEANGLSDELDRVSYLQEQSLMGKLQNLKVFSIQSAKGALERIRTGTFGMCQECEEEIDVKRLEAHPTTPFCIQCQEE